MQRIEFDAFCIERNFDGSLARLLVRGVALTVVTRSKLQRSADDGNEDDDGSEVRLVNPLSSPSIIVSDSDDEDAEAANDAEIDADDDRMRSGIRRRQGNYACQVVTTLAELERHVPAWTDLEARTIEDNFYFSPAALMSTLRHHHTNNTPFFVVLVYDLASLASGDAAKLVACAPFSLLPRTLKTPAPMLSSLVGPHSYLSHPLLDRDAARPALQAIWDWVERPDQPWTLIRMRHMGEGSVTWSLLQDELTRRGRSHWVKSQFTRAMLPRHESFDAFMSALPSSRRKTLRQRMRRLEKLGTVTVHVHRSLDALPDLAHRFMDLEASSWKGDGGSALNKAPANEAFFSEVTKEAARNGQLFFVELRVDERPVAMTTNFIVGKTMFAFKVAYDPAFRDCSPGILAEIETVRAFHEAEEQLQSADSGTAGDSHLDAFWQKTQAMNEIYTSTGQYKSAIHLQTLAGLTRAKRALSEAVDSVRSSVLPKK